MLFFQGFWRHLQSRSKLVHSIVRVLLAFVHVIILFIPLQNESFIALQALTVMSLNLVEVYVHYSNARKKRNENDPGLMNVFAESSMSPSLADEFCVDFNDRSSVTSISNRLMNRNRQDSNDIYLTARTTLGRLDTETDFPPEMAILKEV